MKKVAGQSATFFTKILLWEYLFRQRYLRQFFEGCLNRFNRILIIDQLIPQIRLIGSQVKVAMTG